MLISETFYSSLHRCGVCGEEILKLKKGNMALQEIVFNWVCENCNGKEDHIKTIEIVSE